MENRILSRVFARELTGEEVLQISGGVIYGCPTTISFFSCTVDGDEDGSFDD